MTVILTLHGKNFNCYHPYKLMDPICTRHPYVRSGGGVGFGHSQPAKIQHVYYASFTFW